MAVAVDAIAALAIVAVAAGCGGAVSQATPAAASPSATPAPLTTTSAAASSTTTSTASATSDAASTPLPAGWAYAPLDGVAAPANLADRLPMAIMIDDNTIARPQSGISSASIVYQAYADGGEDRYMFIFQEGTAADIGPVRSARPTTSTGRTSTSPSSAISAETTTPCTPSSRPTPGTSTSWTPNGGSCPYHRVYTRPAPHNAYTNTAVLIKCVAQKGYPAAYQNLPTRTFKDDATRGPPGFPDDKRADHTCTIGYQYDPSTDLYLRSINGKLQTDPADNEQVTANSVIVLYQTVTYFDNSAVEL